MSNYSRAGRIIIANTFLLDRSHNKHSLKVHIDRTSENGKWTMSARKWVPGTYTTQDEYDDDINTGHYEFRPLKDCVLEDVWDALEIKELVIRIVDAARERTIPYEHALAASLEDQQWGFIENAKPGCHTDRFE